MRQDQALDAFIESQKNRWQDPRTVPIYLGVDMGQGYLFSPALPPAEFEAYCRQPRPVLPV